MRERTGNRELQPTRVVVAIAGAFVMLWCCVSTVALAGEGSKTAPRTLEELDAYYPKVASEENGALIYLKAVDAFVHTDYEHEALPLVGELPLQVPVERLSDQTKDLMSKYLVANGPALALLHKAASFPHCRYPIDLTRGMRVELPHLGRLREGERLLCLQALYAAENHDSGTVVWALKDGLTLAQSVREEPLVISQLVRIACCSLAATALEQVLNRHALDEAHLAELQSAFAAMDDQESMARAFEGERCNYLNLPPVDESGHPTFDKEKTFQMLDRVIEASRRPLPEYANEILPLVGDPTAPSRDPARTMGPGSAFPRSALSGIRLSAQLRVAVTALAVERFRAANKKLPEKVADLVAAYLKEPLVDPFDGAPVRYRTTEKGYRVYSVYQNRQDDNGEKGDTRPEKDFVFTVER